MSSNLLLFAAFVAVMLLMSFNYKKKKNKIIFFGDSLTEFGMQPGGYINRIKEILRNERIEENYTIIGSGVGGNKIYDLYLRLEKDILIKDPNIVVMLIGVNDVWHKIKR